MSPTCPNCGHLLSDHRGAAVGACIHCGCDDTVEGGAPYPFETCPTCGKYGKDQFGVPWDMVPSGEPGDMGWTDCPDPYHGRGKWEYGQKIDCDAEGCNPPHVDRDMIIPSLSQSHERINGHLIKQVRRWVSSWQDDPKAPQ